MSSFRGDFLRRVPIPMSAAWLLSDIAEAKGLHGPCSTIG